MTDNGRDISEEVLSDLRARSPRPSLLDEAVAVSRCRFGWYTRQPSRAFEYVWVMERLAPVIGRAVLDIGAGISPIPLLLAKRGAAVTTLDHSPLHRDPDHNDGSWNEWGFLDYSRFHPGIRSLNQDIRDWQCPPHSLDAVYSISVVEHMPATCRRTIWEGSRRWIKFGGALIVTVDVVPGSTDLWNRNQGRPVEPPSDHGTVEDFLGEIAPDFDVVETAWLRDLPHGQPTDCFMVSARRR